MKAIITALVKSQSAIKNAIKDAKNPHLKNNYATLESVIEAVKDIANKNGIAIVQTSGRDEQGDYLDTTLFHESGEKIDSRCYLVLSKSDMQGLGSAITYARRYSLASIFCITQEDDDGNRAVIAPAPKRETMAQAVRKAVEEEMPTPPEEKKPGPFYRFQSGKFIGMQINEVPKDQLENYVGWFKKQQNLGGRQKDILHAMEHYLANFELYKQDEYEEYV